MPCYPESMARDFYDVLGVSRSASADEIKAAYRRLSKELHPDKHTGDKAAEQKFKEVNEAYEVLSNSKKKQMYDQFGAAGANGAGGGGFDFSSFMRGGQAGDLSDLFESFFGGGVRSDRQTAYGEQRGGDRNVPITVEFSAVMHGEERKISVRKYVTCSACAGSGAAPGSQIVSCKECHGTGQVTRTAQSFFGTIQEQYVCPVCRGSGKVPEKPCRTCGGDGRVQETATMTISIPPGISDGQVLRVRGGGDAGLRGKRTGDLYVTVRVKDDPRFQRDGDDVHTALSLSVLDAILGATVAVDSVEGSVNLKIPEGTQPGQVFRLRGKGLPVLSSSRRGDHYAHVEIEIPRKLSRAERKIVEEWRQLRAS